MSGRDVRLIRGNGRDGCSKGLLRNFWIYEKLFEEFCRHFLTIFMMNTVGIVRM